MKFSRFLVSVNLAATIPMALQIGSQAAENTVSDKASWIKDSLVTLRPQTAQKAKYSTDYPTRVTRESSLSEQVRLRPFVANRKLPSERELNLALLPQTARMAPEIQDRLSGQVSAYKQTDTLNTSVQANRKPLSNFASLSVQGNYCHKANTSHFSTTSGTNSDIGNIGKSLNLNHLSSTNKDFSFLQKAEKFLLSQSGKLPQENSLLPEAKNSDVSERENFAAYTAHPIPAKASQEISANQSGKEIATAGPAPFPLNLLPQESLKQFIKSSLGHSRGSTAAQRVSFGSWHDNSRLAALPPAGFRSNMYGRGNIEITGLPRVSYINMQTSRKISSKVRAIQPSLQPAVIKQSLSVRKVLPAELKVAVYPAYTSQSRLF